jgi:hypothetical protein
MMHVLAFDTNMTYFRLLCWGDKGINVEQLAVCGGWIIKEVHSDERISLVNFSPKSLIIPMILW